MSELGSYNSVARQALDVLRKSADGSGHLIPGRDGQRKKDERRWFAPIVDAAGIHDFRWHDLRQTFESRLAMAGVDLRSVQEILGHRSWDTTLRYAHLAPDHQMAPVERLVSIQQGTPTGEATDTKTSTSLPGQGSCRPSDL